MHALVCAFVRALTKLGIAMAAKRPMMATTIMISTRVKPDLRLVLICILLIAFCCCLLRREQRKRPVIMIASVCSRISFCKPHVFGLASSLPQSAILQYLVKLHLAATTASSVPKFLAVIRQRRTPGPYGNLRLGRAVDLFETRHRFPFC